MMFEELTEKNVDKMNGSVSELIKLFYCIVKCNNRFEKSLDEFIDMIDNDEKAVDSFSDYIKSLASDVTDKDSKKKVR